MGWHGIIGWLVGCGTRLSAQDDARESMGGALGGRSEQAHHIETKILFNILCSLPPQRLCLPGTSDDSNFDM
jgi:hypothetical protein